MIKACCNRIKERKQRLRSATRGSRYVSSCCREPKPYRKMQRMDDFGTRQMSSSGSTLEDTAAMKNGCGMWEGQKETESTLDLLEHAEASCCQPYSAAARTPMRSKQCRRKNGMYQQQRSPTAQQRFGRRCGVDACLETDHHLSFEH